MTLCVIWIYRTRGRECYEHASTYNI